MVDAPVHTAPAIPLLETKLYIPNWRPGLVSRPRLVDRLRASTGRKITLVSATAGSGKTTLLAEWLAGSPTGEPAAGWVSLDRNDNAPTRFWAYVIAALRKIQPGVGERALVSLNAPQPPSIESLLPILINDISAVEDVFALVLDDYHVIETPSIHRGIGYLLEHLPRQMQLVIASRSDPPLPLALLRGRGELTELRGPDLRFTAAEASEFLNEAMDLKLSPEDVAALEARTEGWITGLQLAALSMRGREDVHDFIVAFSGDHRFIADFLVEEVLQRQSEQVRNFLLKTSILERLTGPLCDAVTGQQNGKLLLDALERGDVFIVPLDDRRRWYRYHHLFSGVLSARLTEEQPDLVPILHLRASEWYEREGVWDDAVRHALAAEDLERAAGLIERAWADMDRRFQSATWLRWVKALPDEMVRRRPVLSAGYAWALLNGGEPEAAEARLRDAERWLETFEGEYERAETSSEQMVVSDHEQFRSLPVIIARARAYRAQALGAVAESVTYARKALELLPEDDQFERAAVAALLGIAYWSDGDLESAYRTMADSFAGLESAGYPRMAIGAVSVLVKIRAAQGRLREATRLCEEALQWAAEQPEPVFPGKPELFVARAALHYERGELEPAVANLRTGKELHEKLPASGTEHDWYAVRARVEMARGDADSALDLLDEAERLFIRTALPNVRPIAAQKARIWLTRGRLDAAEEWIRERGLRADDDVSFMREFEHLTLVRFLLARFDVDRMERSIHEAIDLLERLLEDAEDGRRMRSVLEMLVLRALCYQATCDVSRALESLGRALTLAEPERCFRTFIDEGEPMRDLLRHATARGIGGSYTRMLLAAFDTPATSDAASVHVGADGLGGLLTPRETEILRLIATGMKNQEIADHLFISLSTVKRHISNAYGKLEVGHRTEAVVRARELDLL